MLVVLEDRDLCFNIYFQVLRERKDLLRRREMKMISAKEISDS